MSDRLAAELIQMTRVDQDLRARLAASGELFGHYHPQMRALHEHHAERLTAIIDDAGWPTTSLVGREANNAAWMIAQHAISRPSLMRTARQAMANAARDDAEAKTLLAYLDDRIAVLEGRPQIYGTQFDWDDDGWMSPVPISDPDRVDERRASVGLGTLAERQRTIRQDIVEHGETAPADLEAYRRAQNEFAREVGWRD